MKQSLQLRIGQSLTMTPQLQQAIRLLQLSTLELQTEIQEALDANPMLEVEEDKPSSDPLEKNTENINEKVEAPASDSDTDNIDLNSTQEIPDDLPVDTNWDDIYDIPPSNTSSAGGDDDKAREFLENQGIDNGGLIEHLLTQLHVTNMSDTDRIIATSIIDAISDDGYLNETTEDIFAALKNELEIELDEVEAVLHLIQRFDPVGIAARDLKECLLLQFDQNNSDNIPFAAKTRQIINEHLDLLGSHDYTKFKTFYTFI